MTDAEIRAVVVEALAYASAHAVRDGELGPAFLRGERDVSLASLGLDSLAAMELCIAIEANTGVEIVPHRLAALGTLGGLVAHVRRRG